MTTKTMIAVGHTDATGKLVVESATAVQYRVCGWCEKPLEPPTVSVAAGSPMAETITHGMCPACKANWDADLAKLREEMDVANADAGASPADA